MSNFSPLGVPFYYLKGTTGDLQKLKFIADGNPGSSCPEKLLQFNTEFTDKPICVASKKYQSLKLQQLETLDRSTPSSRTGGYIPLFQIHNFQFG